MKKWVGVAYVAKCVEESRERRKRKKTKGEGLALVVEEKKRKMGWVGLGWVWGQGANKYIKIIEYIWVIPVQNIVKMYCKNIVDIILF